MCVSYSHSYSSSENCSRAYPQNPRRSADRNRPQICPRPLEEEIKLPKREARAPCLRSSGGAAADLWSLRRNPSPDPGICILLRGASPGTRRHGKRSGARRENAKTTRSRGFYFHYAYFTSELGRREPSKAYNRDANGHRKTYWAPKAQSSEVE